MCLRVWFGNLTSVWDTSKIFQNSMAGAFDLYLTSFWPKFDLLLLVDNAKPTWCKQQLVNTGHNRRDLVLSQLQQSEHYLIKKLQKSHEKNLLNHRVLSVALSQKSVGLCRLDTAGCILWMVHKMQAVVCVALWSIIIIIKISILQ